MSGNEDGARLDRVAFAISQHRLQGVNGGTASGSTWVCGCGASERSLGTRDWAAAQHSRHVAAAVLAACRSERRAGEES